MENLRFVIEATVVGVSVRKVPHEMEPHFFKRSYLKSPHVSGVTGIFQTVLVTLEEEFQEESEKDTKIKNKKPSIQKSTSF